MCNFMHIWTWTLTTHHTTSCARVGRQFQLWKYFTAPTRTLMCNMFTNPATLPLSVSYCMLNLSPPLSLCVHQSSICWSVYTPGSISSNCPICCHWFMDTFMSWSFGWNLCTCLCSCLLVTVLLTRYITNSGTIPFDNEEIHFRSEQSCLDPVFEGHRWAGFSILPGRKCFSQGTRDSARKRKHLLPGSSAALEDWIWW